MAEIYGEVSSPTAEIYGSANDNSTQIEVNIVGAGPPGRNGNDGFSPEIFIEEIEGGHRITVTSASGRESFVVLDGPPGSSSWDNVQDKPFERLGTTMRVVDGTLDVYISENANPAGGNTLSIG